MKIIFKKLVAITLSVLILCTFLNGISVFADQSKSVDVTLSVDKTTLNAGESFTETIGLSNYVNVVKGIQAFIFVIYYDSTKFVSNASAINDRTTHKMIDPNTKQYEYYSDLTVTYLTNKVVIVYLEDGTGASTISGDGPVITVTFTANANATSGVSNFVLGSGDIKTFVDCDAAMPANLRDVYPKFPANATQSITVKGSAKDITLFNFANPASAGSINGTDITVIVPYTTDLTNLIANFISSPSSTVKVSGVTQISGVTKNDFTNPVIYTVIADDRSTKNYTVKVNNVKSSAKDITLFNFANPASAGSINGTDITFIVPYTTNVTNLVANFTSSAYSLVKVGDVIQISGTTANDFTSPITYTVTAEDGTTKGYTVTVSVVKNDAKDFETFSLSGSPGTISEDSIAILVPFGTNISNLVATFTKTGASVKVGETTQINGTTANNFTNAVIYAVIAEDGSTHDYKVIVTIGESTEKDIVTFSVSGVTATISGTDITATVPYGTDLLNLVANFIKTGKSITVGGITQISGKTANNFTNKVKYDVTAQDGSTKTYTVTISVAPKNAKDINTFSISGLSGTINGTNITVNVPFGTDITKLVADFTTLGKNVNVGTTKQTPGVTANNFTKSATYMVIAEDGTTKDYTVTVIVAKAQDKDIKTFSISSSNGIVSGSNIAVMVPYGSNPKHLVATFTFLGKNVKVGDVTQVSGTTANDFSNSVIYTVTANNGTKKTYTVTVTVAAEVVSSNSSSSSSSNFSTNSSNPKTPNKVNVYFIIIMISLFLLFVAGILWIVFRKKLL